MSTKLFSTTDNAGLTLIRVVLGAVMLPHGLQKTFGMFGGYGWEGTMGFFTGQMGIPAIFAALAILAESAGALGLITGFLGRVAALPGGELLDLVTFYAQNLAVPARRGASDAAVLKGKMLFHQAGCAACHTPSFTTGTAEGQPHLSNQRIWPYSDFLLHDMGDGLADGRPDYLADGREWRTPALWGLGLVETVLPGASFLHDGRARTIAEAILWHGGEAEPAREAFRTADAADRAALLAFLHAL